MRVGVSLPFLKLIKTNSILPVKCILLLVYFIGFKASLYALWIFVSCFSLTLTQILFSFQGDCWICMELMSTSFDKFYKYVYSVLDDVIPEEILGKITLAVSILLNFFVCVFEANVKNSDLFHSFLREVVDLCAAELLLLYFTTVLMILEYILTFP